MISVRYTLSFLDIDECVTRTHNCGMGFQCQNTDGSFTCNLKQRCLTGFTQDSHSNCIGKTGKSQLQSHSVPPSGQMHEEYQIKAKTLLWNFLQESCFFVSFSFSFYDFHAVSRFILDIDECSSVSEPCTNGFNCINTVGSYTCQRKIIMCSRGYHSSADGARCIGEDAHKYTQLYLNPLLELNPFRHRFIF